MVLIVQCLRGIRLIFETYQADWVSIYFGVAGVKVEQERWNRKAREAFSRHLIRVSHNTSEFSHAWGLLIEDRESPRSQMHNEFPE